MIQSKTVHRDGRSRQRAMFAAIGGLLASLSCHGAAASGARFHDPEADAPYKIWETMPALTMTPLVLDPSGTAAVIEWTTDSDADGSVHWGEGKLDHVTMASHDGLVDVGTFHRVVVEGLQPGHTYRYQVASRRVVAMKAYWPERGSTARGEVASFRTLDEARARASFAVITDTHEKVSRIEGLMKALDPASVDFVVHDGDTVNYAVSEQQVKDVFLEPTSAALKGSTPLLYARGNHEYRGAYARQLGPYLKAPENSYDFARDDGPVHLIVIDTGEDKPDETNVYAGLNALTPYRRAQFQRFKAMLGEPRVAAAPFTVLLAHQKDFGWLGGDNEAWMQAANAADIDLFIAGHEHRFEHIKPGMLHGNRFPILVVGQDQYARVEADASTLNVVVTGLDGKVVDAFTLRRRHQAGRVP